jgi:hypothetical protein
MSVHVEIHKATFDDVVALAPRMRPADALEVKRAAGFSPIKALAESLAASGGRAWATYFDAEPVAMFGLCQPELLGPTAIPWLLTGYGVEKHPTTFMRLARSLVDKWAIEFPTLIQFVDEEYVQAQRFLRHLGFTIYPAVEHGVERAPFCPAVRSRHV